MITPEVLWTPPADVRQTTRVGAYLRWLAAAHGHELADYESLWGWSTSDLDGFWSSIWDFFDVIGHRGDTVLAGPAMPGARWFPGTKLNYAENMLARLPADDVVVVGRSQTRGPVELTGAQLRARVGAAQAGLRRLGVRRGDRVAAFLPNIPETLVLLLAAAGIGAVFSSCAPEFGAKSVIDRWRQINPTLLVTVDGYRYGDKAVDTTSHVAVIRAALPSLRRTVVLPYLSGDPGRVPGALAWDELLAEPAEPSFEPVPFDHPLYVVYSSGTTGLPKAIVHGHGGILLEHLKALALQMDVRAGDRFFWFSTTGWMMWNFSISALAAGSGILLFDGDPAFPDLSMLWRLAAECGVTYFGTSAPFLLSCRRLGVSPRSIADTSRIRGVGSTGSPLPIDGFEYVYREVGEHLLLQSFSGGTDLCTGFLGGCPLVPGWAGEISCRCLGARVEAYDPAGRPVVGRPGELVITAPMPSMPVGLWGDADGSRYRAAYFSTFPSVWRHGDWVTITDRGSCVVTGRSDATLNRGGVRIGTAEFYAVLEEILDVADSLVVHIEGGSDGLGELWLFVVPAAGVALDDGLRRRIRTALRTELSPRHVPNHIVAVPAVPRTLSGKKLEVPVKRILAGAAVDEVASTGALADPAALAPFVELARTLRR